MDTPYRVVLVTASSMEEADKIARAIVGERLAACVNILGGVKSYFWWEEKIDEAQEILLVIKSEENRIPRLIERVKNLHSYSVPEVIALPVAEGNPDYLKWLEKSLMAP